MPFLLIDKPVGPTSHDIIDQVRRITGERRVGHAGTLDPFASGLLIVAVGRDSTKELSKFVGLDKVYEATFVLGASSDTDDITGKITLVPIPIFESLTPFRLEKKEDSRRPSSPPGLGEEGNKPPPNAGGGGCPLSMWSRGGGFENKIKAAMQKFVGEIEQAPPAYAAIKIGGKKMYEAAREGKPLKAKARAVMIFEFDLLEKINFHHSTTPSLHDSITLKTRIRCSSGTYIRALARDLGRALGTGGYVSELRRTAIGSYRVEEAKTL